MDENTQIHRIRSRQPSGSTGRLPAPRVALHGVMMVLSGKVDSPF